GLRDAVQQHGQNHHGNARFKAIARAQALNSAPHLTTQAIGTNHGRNHHHGQCQHNRLVDAGHDGRQRQGQLNLKQLLHTRGTVGVGRFNQLFRNLAYAQYRQANGRRHREDDSGENGRYRSNTEKRNSRNQINKRWHRLHEVQHRHRQTIQARRQGRQNTNGQGNDNGHQGGNHHQRQGLHHGLPITHVPDKTQPKHSAQRKTPPGHAPANSGDNGQQPPLGDSQQGVIQNIDAALGKARDAACNGRILGGEPVQPGFNPFPDRDARQIAFHYCSPALASSSSTAPFTTTPNRRSWSSTTATGTLRLESMPNKVLRGSS